MSWYTAISGASPVEDTELEAALQSAQEFDTDTRGP